jgi:hypothetical protein
MKNLFLKKREYFTAFFLWAIVFSLYVKTMAPTIGFIDSGELATVACTLGIAHPTGYPLFTLIGRIFSIFPFSPEEIVRLNIMSALLTSLSVVIFFFIILEIFGKKGDRNLNIIASSSSSLFLAFSQTVWSQGLSVEVYSLHLLLIALATLFFLKAINEDKSSLWFLFAYMLGLAFTNHLTTILLAPAFLFLFFYEHKFSRTAFIRILRLVVPFLAGLSVYLYLPIRATSSPPLNWGNPASVEKFWWHFTGKQFRVWMFSSTAAAEKQFNYFLHHSPIDFFYIPLGIALIGFFSVFFLDKRIFIFILLLLATCVGYAINYDIHDIDSYFLLAFLALMMFAAFGVLRLLDISRKVHFIVPVFLLAGSIFIEGYNNIVQVDQSSNYLVEDYAKNILNNVPRGSIILSYEWDYFVSASYYFQQVKHYRSDVVVLDKELFRRSWYFLQTEKMYPKVMKQSFAEIELFLTELFKFEHDTPYNYEKIEEGYNNFLESIFRKNLLQRECFVTPEIEQNYTRGFIRIPYGLVQKISKDSSYVTMENPTYNFRPIFATNIYSTQLKKIAFSSLFQRSLYDKRHGNDSLASISEMAANQLFLSQHP